MRSDSSRSDSIDEIARSGCGIVSRLTAQQQETLDRLDVAGQAMLDGLTESQREIADFVAERVRHNIETQRAMMSCRTPDDLRGVQVTFLRDAVDQYRSGVTRLLDLGRKTLARSVKPPLG